MKKIILPALAASMILFTGCMGGGGSSSAQEASADGAAPSAGLVLGPSCQGGESQTGQDHLCVALRYVGYADETGKPSVTQAQAADNVDKINADWAQCGIGFQIEQYDSVDPAKLGLTYATANQAELDEVRNALMTQDKLLVVTTGKWNRRGSLGATAANAWTSMPGENRDGAVLESSVATFPNIIAHELGHYLNLGHVNDTSDLMNPVIYDTSTQLTAGQCAEARDAIEKYWPKMKR